MASWRGGLCERIVVNSRLVECGELGRGCDNFYGCDFVRLQEDYFVLDVLLSRDLKWSCERGFGRQGLVRALTRVSATGICDLSSLLSFLFCFFLLREAVCPMKLLESYV